MSDVKCDYRLVGNVLIPRQKQPDTPLSPREYATLSAGQCDRLNPSERDLLARILEREITRKKRTP